LALGELAAYCAGRVDHVVDVHVVAGRVGEICPTSVRDTLTHPLEPPIVGEVELAVGFPSGTTTGPATPAAPRWMCAPVAGRTMFETLTPTSDQVSALKRRATRVLHPPRDQQDAG